MVLEKTLESPLDCKEIKPVSPKGNQSWIFIGKTDDEAETPIFWPTWCEEPTHWKRPWCWERLKAGGEVDDRGWDGWMASPTWWTWVWVGSRNWWWTGKPGVLQSMGSQRIRHDWVIELNSVNISNRNSGSTYPILFFFFFFNPILFNNNKWNTFSLIWQRETHLSTFSWIWKCYCFVLYSQSVKIKTKQNIEWII